MKKNYLSFVVVYFSIASLMAQAKFPGLKKGDVLVYEVHYADMVYDFTAVLTDLGKGVTFDWAMSDPVTSSGTMKLSSNALKNAELYQTYFIGGEMELDDKSSVFLSDKCYKAFQKNGKTSFDMGNGIFGEWGNCGYCSGNMLDITYKGTTVQLDIYNMSNKVQDVDYDISVLKGGKYHLITRMNLGWTIHLKEIR